MRIKKRDGSFEKLSFDRISYRLRKLAKDTTLGKLNKIDVDIIVQKVVERLYDSMPSSEIDEESARIAVSMIENEEYPKLASRIIINNLHKNTVECFSDVMESLNSNLDIHEERAPIVSDDFISWVRKYKNEINDYIDFKRDFNFDYFGFKTLEKSYLFKMNEKVVERPQHLYMRVALSLHQDDLENTFKTYDLISQGFYTHASPTMFNAGKKLNSLSSCFHEDTVVATVNRGSLKIKDVQIGDSVITHLGNVKKVEQLHKNLLNDRKLYTLNIAKTVPIKVTDNHKIWVVSHSYKKNEPRNGRTNYDLEFVKNFLKEQNCELLSTEYKNMKTKLEYICVCGNKTNTSFESMYYHNIKCTDKKCMISRKTEVLCNRKVVSKPYWKSVSELQDGDYIGIPNKKQSVEFMKTIDILKFKDLMKDNEDIKYFESHSNQTVTFKSSFINGKKSLSSFKLHSSLNRYWKVNKDFAKFVGVFYGDGNIQTGKNTKGNDIVRGIAITIHNINTNLIDFCKKIGKEIFGIEPTIHNMKSQNVIQVIYNSGFIGQIFKECFGKGFNGKRIWTEMYSWDKDLVVALLEGLITTDGCVTKKNQVMLQMSNVEFMRQLYYLLRNNSIDTSYGKESRNKNGTQDHVNINISIEEINKLNIDKYYEDNRMMENKVVNCRNGFSNIIVDGFKFLKFKSKTEITENLPKYVYTLGIEHDHSYNVGGIVAENCFLLGTEDSIEGIFKTITDCAKISKVGGGIGVHVSNIRSRGSIIRKTNGISDGIIPMLKVYNDVSVYVNQSSRRKGSFAVYLEPFHADIMEFLDLKKNQGHEDLRARDLFYAMWIPDLFMEKVEKNEPWYLMCPDQCPGLTDVYGEEFNALYNKYVEGKRYIREIPAQEIWTKILESQIETGTPYLLYKDAINRKSNQKNIGVIKSSNLCVAPDTMILTKTGYRIIKSLENKNVQVWNGNSFTDTIVRKTGENKKLLSLLFNNGVELKCTPEHIFYNKVGEKIRAKDLQTNDTLLKCKFPKINEGILNLVNPYKKTIDKKYLQNIRLLVQLSGKDTRIVETSDYMYELKDITNDFELKLIVKRELPELSDTYCFTECERGMGVFNGILTGQCAEITLVSNSEEIAVCFSGDTEILTDIGVRKIKDCDNLNVLSYFNNDKDLKIEEKFVKAKLINNGEKDLYEIKLTGTKSIKATENHLFLTINRDKNKSMVWKKLKELDIYDQICLPYNKPIPNYDIDILKDFDKSYLTVGWMLGDGWQCKITRNNLTRSCYGVCFGPNEEFAKNNVVDVLNNWHKECESYFKDRKYVQPKVYIDKNKVYNWVSSKQSFTKYIQTKFGLMEHKSALKCIPDKIKYESSIKIASFLSGLFSADGSVNLQKRKLSKIYRFGVSLSSASKTLLEETQALLRPFGIKSTVVFTFVKTKGRCQGRLNIEGIDSIKNYSKYINFLLCKEKQQILETGLKISNKTHRNINHVTVEHIEWCGKEIVYDLNVPNTHNFIAGGVSVHNCNLSSISLPKYVEKNEEGKLFFNHEKLFEVAKYIITPMNKVIDLNYYPTEECKLSNMRHRPLGIGVQGLHDTFILLKMSFSSPEARELNKRIFETIYYGTLVGSNELAKKDGTYSTFKDSPASQGQLQFDLWDIEEENYLKKNGLDKKGEESLTYNWTELKESIAKYGLRNSMLTTCMPTASSAQILGNCESIEPFDSCIFKRRVLSGEYIIVNKHLLRDLTELKIWNKQMKDQIILNNGSIQNIPNIPDKIKELYKTVWEMSMKDIIVLSADRGRFIDHTQSLNLFIADPTISKLTSMHFFAWKKHLKTGLYYLRSKESSGGAKFSIDPEVEKTHNELAKLQCSIDNKEDCMMCSS